MGRKTPVLFEFKLLGSRQYHRRRRQDRFARPPTRKRSSRGWTPAATPCGLQLYPNPTRDQLTITGAFERGDALQVLDAAGREVMRLTAQEHVMQLNVRDLRPGTYTLHWSGAKGRGSARFVVMW